MVDFSLDKSSPVPFYRQVVDMVLAGLSGGRILPGEKLPTIRDLAVKLEVNPNTVVKAYSHLELLGVLDTQQGSGVFVNAAPAKALSSQEEETVLSDLCRDFVSRAQLYNIGIDRLIRKLEEMKG
jgi:GntR family transcriptional regulator